MCLEFVLHYFGTDLFFNTRGFGLTRLCKTTKVKYVLVGWIYNNICLNPFLFFWKCGLFNILLWIPGNLEQTCYRNLPTNRQHRTKGSPEEDNIGPRGTPTEVSKTRSQTKRAGALTPRANGSQIEANIWKLGVFWIFVRRFPVSCVLLFSVWFIDLFGINFSIIKKAC